MPSTAQVAFQQADYVAWNVWAAVAERPLLPFKYQHIGDMMTTGAADAAVALPVGDVVVDGVAGAALRRAACAVPHAHGRAPRARSRARGSRKWARRSRRRVRRARWKNTWGWRCREELKTLEKMLPSARVLVIGKRDGEF